MTTTEEKALKIWENMSANERYLVRFGMFPARTMAAAKAEGFDNTDLAGALMEVAKQNGGTIA